jgi:DNA end-binding protein Ku
MRPSWTGFIKIAAIEIPVQLFPATEEASVSLTSLHATDLGPLRRDTVCTTCAHTVSGAETVKALAVGKGEHVVISVDDLAALAPTSRNVIDIREFVPLSSIPREHFEKPYFVVGDDETYSVVHLALAGKDLAGIGKLSIESRERLVAFAVSPGFGLMLFVLRHANEMRHLEPVHSVADPGHVAGVERVIFVMTQNDFRPATYTDEYTAGLVALGELRRGAPRAGTVDLASAIAASGGVDKQKNSRAGGRSRVRTTK